MFLQLSIFIKVFYLDFSGKDSTCHAGGAETPSREGNSNPLQCSCLKNSMHRGTWQAI